MVEPPPLTFDRHGEAGDEDVDETDAGDKEASWVPDPSQRAGLPDLFRDQFGAVAVFGGLLIVAGTVLQLSSGWSRGTVFGLGLLLIFACLLLLAIGTTSGFLPIVSAGGAGLIELVVQFSFWPGSPPLWATVPVQGAGAVILIVGTLQARKATSRDHEE